MLKHIGAGGGAASDSPQLLSGKRYSTWKGAIASTAALSAVDRLHFYPFRVAAQMIVTAGYVYIQTGGAGSSVKVGVWRNSPVSNRPLGAPVLADNAGVATATSVTQVAVAMAGTLIPDWYWVGAKHTGTSPMTFSVPNGHAYLAATMGATSVQANMIYSADAYANALPTFTEGQAVFSEGGGAVPILYLQV